MSDGQSVRCGSLNGEPWKDRGPVALESVSLEDVDDADLTFQVRFRSDWVRLKESLRERGQLNPIKLLAGENAFRIVDGHSRFRAIKDLGWSKVEAMLYRGMSDREAKALSYEANVTRRNLSFVEKANAMQDAVNEGFSRDVIAGMFGVARRTVDRHLELPEELRRHIDCRAVTMAHGRALKPLVGAVPQAVIEDLVVWIKATSASERDLKQRLKADALIDRRGAKRKFGAVGSGSIRGYRFELGPRSTRADRLEAMAFFRRAIEMLEELG